MSVSEISLTQFSVQIYTKIVEPLLIPTRVIKPVPNIKTKLYFIVVQNRGIYISWL
jgi:hypothetical protein